MPVPVIKDAELVEFFHKGRKQTYKKGDTILRAGDTPQGIYWIEKGYVKIYALAKHGVVHTHTFYGPGDIFPMIWAFNDAIRNVYYEAAVESVIWLVPKDNFKAFIDTHAHSAFKLLEQAVDMFQLYAGRIDNLLYSSAYERTAYRILSITDRWGEKQADGSWLVDAPITHQDIASSVNLSRETVSRCFARLHAKGLISQAANHRIKVKDIAGLAHIVGEDEVIGMWPEFAEYLPK